MVTLIYSTSITHITDSDPFLGESVKTRCGRTLKSFFSGGTGKNCPRCGEERDFNQVLEASLRAKAEQRFLEKEQSRCQKEIQARRLIRHRELLVQFKEMVEKSGATIENFNETPAGGRLEFKLDGLKFELRGNI